MADSLTTVYKFVLPEVGASSDTWGGKLNDDFTKVDLLFGQAFTGGDEDTVGTIRTSVLPIGPSNPYVLKTGDTMTGSLKISRASGGPALRFAEEDQSADLSTWSSQVINSYYQVAPETDANGALSGYFRLTRNLTGLVDALLEVSGSATAATDDRSIINRARGDFRYLMKGGDTLTGPIVAPADATYWYTFTNGAGIASTSAGDVAIKGADSALDFIYYGGSGGPATAVNDTVILSRKMGDARFAQKTTSIIAGAGLVTGGALGADVTLDLGTPLPITFTSTNTATADGHSHAISEGTIRSFIAQGNAGGTGTYALLHYTPVTQLSFDNTTAGSNLYPANAGGSSVGVAQVGTWRCMGHVFGGSGSDRTTVFLRIA